jgi:hypothetical protein
VLSAPRGQGHSFDQDAAVPKVEIEEPRQFGKFIVAQQPSRGTKLTSAGPKTPSGAFNFPLIC